MENVKALTQKKFLPYLLKWERYLGSLGYTNFTKVLNAKNYGVPQNRERVFMVSILGDAWYDFPKPFELDKVLKDVLETNVDDKYYLSPKLIDCFIRMTDKAKKKGNGFRFNPTDGYVVAKTITTHPNDRTGDNFIFDNKRLQKMVDDDKISGDRVEYIDAYNSKTSQDVSGTIATRVDASNCSFIKGEKSIMPVSPTLRATDYKCPCTAWENNSEAGYRIRKLTPRECFRLMGVSESNIDKIQAAGISKTQQYKMAGNSIVVDVLFYILRNLLYNDKENVYEQVDT